MITVKKDINGINVIEVTAEEIDLSSAKLIATRLAVCNTCEFVSENKSLCSKCSCLLINRVSYIESFCPVEKW